MTAALITRRFFRNIIILPFGWVGDGASYSRKLSVKLLWEPRDIWIGLYWDWQSRSEWTAYLCVVPCLPIRIHLIRSYGGVFPEAVA